MDVSAIRLENLRLLVHELKKRRPEWLQKDIALALGMSPSYLSQLVGGKKIGDEVARKIETTRQLAHGWMDTLQATPKIHEQAPGDYLSRPLRIDPDTIAAALQLVRLSFENLGLEIDQEENGTPLALAYDFLIERSEKAATVTNLLEFKPRMEKLTGGWSGKEEPAGNRTTRSSAR